MAFVGTTWRTVGAGAASAHATGAGETEEVGAAPVGVPAVVGGVQVAAMGGGAMVAVVTDTSTVVVGPVAPGAGRIFTTATTGGAVSVVVGDASHAPDTEVASKALAVGAMNRSALSPSPAPPTAIRARRLPPCPSVVLFTYDPRRCSADCPRPYAAANR